MLFQIKYQIGTHYIFILFIFTKQQKRTSQAGASELVEAYTKFNEKGFEIFAVAYEGHSQKLQKFINENNMIWINVCGNEDTAGSSKWSKEYALTGIPDNVLIDCSTGIIIGREMRFRLVSTLENLL